MIKMNQQIKESNKLIIEDSKYFYSYLESIDFCMQLYDVDLRPEKARLLREFRKDGQCTLILF
jgi:hypothetical protein